MNMECILQWIESHQGLAAWVQALFSIVAIFATYYMAKQQFLKAKELQSEATSDEAIRQVKILLTIYESVYEKTSDHVDAINNNQDDENLARSFNIQRFERNLKYLSQIPLMSLPDARLAEGLSAVVGVYETFLSFASKAHAVAHSDDAFRLPKYIDNPDSFTSRILVLELNAELSSAILNCLDFIQPGSVKL